MTYEPNLYNSIYDLKKDMKFCEAISEIVSGVLKVEEIRSNLRDLYLKEDPQRKVTLSMDLDDDNLNGLTRSRQLLGKSSDLQQDFWYAVLKATKSSLNIPEFDSDKRQKIFISKNLKLKIEFIEDLFKNLDYDDINLENNLELILKLFKKIKLDVNKYNELTTRGIDLTEYYISKLENLKLKYKTKYISYLYNEIKKQSLDNKKAFLTKKNNYENFKNYQIKNSVDFNINRYFAELLSNNFSVSFENISKQETIDLNEIYNTTENKLQEILKHKYNATSNLIETFLNRSEYKSMIYFDEIDYLEKKYISNYKSTNGEDKSSTKDENRKYINFNGKEIQYNSFEELSKNIVNVIANTNYDVKEINTNKPVNVKKVKNFPGKMSGGRRPKNTEEIGFLGECFVYHMLIKEYGKENVEWISENATKAKVNENGDDSLGYDMRYIDQNSKNIYVEVKSTTGDEFVFPISKNEVVFGEKVKDSYEIYFVFNVKDTTMQILRLKQFFKYRKGETFNENSKFLVETDGFKIRFESE